jgi:hypothetical protein
MIIANYALILREKIILYLIISMVIILIFQIIIVVLNIKYL